MKKNYIAPSTEMINLASEGIMQPAIGLGTVTSGAQTGEQQVTGNLIDID